MGENSKIEWTHHTFNPWWGCVRVSPGCQRCYAETFAKRVGQKVWGVDADRRFFGDKHWREPLKWDAAARRLGERRRVFCASMADVFEIPPNLVTGDKMREARRKLATLIEATPSLDWLLLTKRPQNVLEVFPSYWFRERHNVWVGTTVEDQQRADERIPQLLRIPASVLFISAEPLLESVNLRDWLKMFRNDHVVDPTGDAYRSLDWVIVGGESGHGARPFDFTWARSLVEQCRAAGVPCFMKQLGANRQWSMYVDGVTPDLIKDRKGGDWSEWPVDLRVRELPRVA